MEFKHTLLCYFHGEKNRTAHISVNALVSMTGLYGKIHFIFQISFLKINSKYYLI